MGNRTQCFGFLPSASFVVVCIKVWLNGGDWKKQIEFAAPLVKTLWPVCVKHSLDGNNSLHCIQFLFSLCTKLWTKCRSWSVILCCCMFGVSCVHYMTVKPLKQHLSTAYMQQYQQQNHYHTNTLHTTAFQRSVHCFWGQFQIDWLLLC